MSGETKKEAIQKLNSVTIQVGYPDVWPENPLEILSPEDKGSFFQALSSYYRTYLQKSIVEQHKTTPPGSDFSEIGVTTVTAASNRVSNTILLPAGFLQAPFFATKNKPTLKTEGVERIIRSTPSVFPYSVCFA